MLGRVAGQVFDVMIHPQIRKFCLSSALRMNEADLLRGGAAAAHAVLSASAAKRLHGDPAPLADLATSGSLHPYLHSMLANTGQHGDSVALEALHRRHLGATATLEHTRLIVGARRSTYLSSDRAVRNYRCTLGSHLVVIADRPHGTPEACPTVASHATSCPAAFMCPPPHSCARVLARYACSLSITAACLCRRPLEEPEAPGAAGERGLHRAVRRRLQV